MTHRPHLLRLAKLTVKVRPGGTRDHKVLITCGRIRHNACITASAEDAGAIAVEELFAAAEDSDGFVREFMGESTGRQALKKGKAAEKIVRAAKKFPYQALVDAVDAARERGLL